MSENLAAWQALLDQLERALDAADAALIAPPVEDGAKSLTVELDAPPGPIPGEVIERARMVLARQQMMIRQTATAKVNITRELAALRRVPGQSGSPAFLDVEG